MKYHQTYSGLIFTNHALDRMEGRGLSQNWAWETWNNPEQTDDGGSGNTRYVRHFDNHTVTVVAKQNEKREWIIISAWVDPPMPGSTDRDKRKKYHTYQKASFLRKLWLTLRQQIGI